MVKPCSLILKVLNLLLRSSHSTIKLREITLVQIELQLVIVRDVVKLIASQIQFFRMVNDNTVKFVDFSNETIALNAVSVLQFAQLFHDFRCVLLQICKDLLGESTIPLREEEVSLCVP